MAFGPTENSVVWIGGDGRNRSGLEPTLTKAAATWRRHTFTLHNNQSVPFRSLRLAYQHPEFSVISGASVGANSVLAISGSMR